VLFASMQFFAFLAIMLAAFWLAPSRWRKWILLAGSYYFYACWNVKFVPLLATLTAIDYSAALWIDRTIGARRRAALGVSLAANLAFLGFFKYYNFAASIVAGLAGKPPDSFALNILLPLGISFHTFQSISYVVDVYRGQQKPIRNLADYALFICFFPQLVAGPIVRAWQFFRDLYNWRLPTSDEVQRGILLVILGLTKKVVLADQAALISDGYFGNLAAHPGILPAWSGAAAFVAQIYFDFSGYSDMAIGMALLFGFRFPENFRRPFLSDCITEYWQRWHMTLSRWLRDYVYFPLGGRSRRPARTYSALLITLLLAGLWHGAAWHFVTWGAVLGVVISLERAAGIRPVSFHKNPLLHTLRVPLAFCVFAACGVLFRVPHMSDAGVVYSQMFSGAVGAPLFNAWQTGLGCCALLLAVLEEWLGWFERLITGPVWAYGAALAVFLAALEMFSVTERSVPFFYFQF
jgi:alginate O-acetyltransferase complex protein AlgI